MVPVLQRVPIFNFLLFFAFRKQNGVLRKKVIHIKFYSSHNYNRHSTARPKQTKSTRGFPTAQKNLATTTTTTTTHQKLSKQRNAGPALPPTAKDRRQMAPPKTEKRSAAAATTGASIPRSRFEKSRDGRVCAPRKFPGVFRKTMTDVKLPRCATSRPMTEAPARARTAVDSLKMAARCQMSEVNVKRSADHGWVKIN